MDIEIIEERADWRPIAICLVEKPNGNIEWVSKKGVRKNETVRLEMKTKFPPMMLR